MVNSTKENDVKLCSENLFIMEVPMSSIKAEEGALANAVQTVSFGSSKICPEQHVGKASAPIAAQLGSSLPIDSNFQATKGSDDRSFNLGSFEAFQSVGSSNISTGIEFPPTFVKMEGTDSRQAPMTSSEGNLQNQAVQPGLYVTAHQAPTAVYSSHSFQQASTAVKISESSRPEESDRLSSQFVRQSPAPVLKPSTPGGCQSEPMPLGPKPSVPLSPMVARLAATAGCTDGGVQFGSQLVSPHSPTPYTDATQTKKNSPLYIKRPMNAFMVFSHYERKKVLQEMPDINNIMLSKELGRRWKDMTYQEREPFLMEADRLRQLHVKEYPNYKYRPSKRKNRAAKQNLTHQLDSPNSAKSDLSSKLESPNLELTSSWPGSSRISISTGQRGILKSININRLNHRVTIDRKFRDSLRSAAARGGSGSKLTASDPSGSRTLTLSSFASVVPPAGGFVTLSHAAVRREAGDGTSPPKMAKSDETVNRSIVRMSSSTSQARPANESPLLAEPKSDTSTQGGLAPLRAAANTSDNSETSGSKSESGERVLLSPRVKWQVTRGDNNTSVSSLSSLPTSPENLASSPFSSSCSSPPPLGGRHNARHPLTSSPTNSALYFVNRSQQEELVAGPASTSNSTISSQNPEAAYGENLDPALVGTPPASVPVSRLALHQTFSSCPNTPIVHYYGNNTAGGASRPASTTAAKGPPSPLHSGGGVLDPVMGSSAAGLMVSGAGTAHQTTVSNTYMSLPDLSSIFADNDMNSEDDFGLGMHGDPFNPMSLNSSEGVFSESPWLEDKDLFSNLL